MKFTLVLFFASLACTTAAGASSQCRDSVSNDTIAFFSSAPITFGSNFTNFTACASKCKALDTCQSWLFSSGGGRCELFANPAVTTAQNPNFVYGGCKNIESTSSMPPASSSASLLRSSLSALVPDVSQPCDFNSFLVNGKVPIS